MSDLIKAIVSLVILGLIGNYLLANADQLGLPKGLGLYDTSNLPTLIVVVIVLAAIAFLLFRVYQSMEEES